jgi:hypothetical protein
VTTEAFQRVSRKRPFEPFALHVADARVFVVRHPDAAVLTGGGRTVSVLNDSGTIEVIDLLLVTSLRPLAESETRRARRRR